MDRRKFLVGLGSASVGGSALVGSGAFSRVESHRTASVVVANDADAYLGLDKCPGSPNNSYAHHDENGHLALLMDETNPTHNGEQAETLGAGVNSNSISVFHDVFQICNQGKQPVCVWLDVDAAQIPDAAAVPEDAAFGPGDDAILFYEGSDEDARVEGEDNGVQLDVGDCICVSVTTRSFGLSEGDEFLTENDTGHEMVIHADSDGACFAEPQSTCQVWCIDRESSNPGLRPVSVVSDGTLDGVGSSVATLPDGAGERNYPNGLAFDVAQARYYFATTVGSEKGVLHSYDATNGVTEYEAIGGGRDIAGAAFHDGKYYYVPNGTNKLKTAVVDTYGSAGSSVTTQDVGTLNDSHGFGDIAVDEAANDLYFSTVGGDFLRYDLDTDTETDIGGDAAGKQIAFGHGILWAHDANSGEWFTVDTSDGSTTFAGETRTFTDIAKCGRLPLR